MCVCVCVCEEDDGRPIFGKAPFFLFDSKTAVFALGLSEALVATSLRTFIEVYDGC